MANPPLHAVPALLAEDPAVVAAATAADLVAVPEVARPVFVAALGRLTGRRPLLVAVPTQAEAERGQPIRRGRLVDRERNVGPLDLAVPVVAVATVTVRAVVRVGVRSVVGHDARVLPEGRRRGNGVLRIFLRFCGEPRYGLGDDELCRIENERFTRLSVVCRRHSWVA